MDTIEKKPSPKWKNIEIKNNLAEICRRLASFVLIQVVDINKILS